MHHSTCSFEKSIGDGCIYPQCSPICSEQLLAVSLDQRHCVSCENQATYNIITGECECPDGYRRVEIYDRTSSSPIGHDCLACPDGTAVFKHKRISTGGASFQPDPYVCAHCPDPDMRFDTDNNCKCRDGFIMTGEASIGPQECIPASHMPSVSTDYSTVNFNFVQSPEGKGRSRAVIESIIFSHLYLAAASRCEFSEGQSSRSVNACQTLANLCVMSSYDNNAAPCRQLQLVSRGEVNLMRKLIYSGDRDDIIHHRGIQMKMSLEERDGFEHKLDFRLAKYALNGEFVGFERLKSQFIPNGFASPESEGISSEIESKDFIFGEAVSVELGFDLSELIDAEMYLYELYVVDKATTTCGMNAESTSDECLYPVPVMLTSYTHGNAFPNVNKSPLDESDDKYVRRFFLFDNMSGRTQVGVQYIRFVSKIVLQTTIQEASSSKIYPPILMIHYAEINMNDLNTGSKTSYRIEYNIRSSTKFWTAVKVTVGFISATALLIWVFRTYNWQNRNRKSIPLEEEGVLLDFSTHYETIFLVHTLMIGLHTFVITFLPFIFLLCSVW